MNTRTLIVDGVRTPLREAGPRTDREAVVCIHGNPGSGADWVDLLDRIGMVSRAVAWDMPGFGQADKPVEFPHTLTGHARFISATLDALCIQRAHLVLHDLGGLWGLHWAVTDPERFASVTLLNAGLFLDYRWHRLARIWQTRGLGELFMATLNRPAFRRSIQRGNPRPLPEDLVDRMYQELDRPTRRAILYLYRSMTDLSPMAAVAAELRRLDRPALVVWGAHDPYLPVDMAHRQRRPFPGARVEILDGSGHWPLVDDPQRCAPLVTEFLQQHLWAR